jgi:hypothetical protein
MLPANEVDPYNMVAILKYGAPTQEDTDESNHVTGMIRRVSESEQDICPTSDNEDGDDLNLTEKHDWFGPYQMLILLIMPLGSGGSKGISLSRIKMHTTIYRHWWMMLTCTIRNNRLNGWRKVKYPSQLTR